MANSVANISNFINGEWLAGSGAELITINPATGKQTWSSHESTAVDVAQATTAARAAFDAWALTPLEQRIAVCTRFRDLLKQDAEELALLISEEVGKPLWEVAHRSHHHGQQDRHLGPGLRRAHWRIAQQDRRWRSGAASSSARRVRRIRSVQLPRPPAEWPHRAGADRREHAGVQTERIRAAHRHQDRAAVGDRPACRMAC